MNFTSGMLEFQENLKAIWRTGVTIPDYQSLMLPLLIYASDGNEHSLRDAIEALATKFSLTPDERREVLPSGRQATFDNRVGWSRTYLKKAGLLTSPKRSYFQITQRGQEVLAQKPASINVAFLRQFPEFIEFQLGQNKNVNVIIPEVAELVTPEESIENAYQRARASLAVELLQTVKDCSPEFFERLVVDLLVRMGYGGTRKDAGQAIPAIRQLSADIERRKIAACIFPEGTRARDGQLKKFKASGVMALLENAPSALVVPVAISGSWRLVMHSLLPIPFGTHVYFDVLAPIEPRDSSPAEINSAAENLIRAKLAARS